MSWSDGRSYTGAMPSPRVLFFGGVLLCAWCGWVSGFHTDSAAAVATWLVSVAVVACIDLTLWSKSLRPEHQASHLSRAEPWPRPGNGGAGPALSGLSPWLLLIGLGAAWDVLGIDTGPRQAHLTISALAQAFRPVNAALLLVWIFVGLGIGLARARAPRTTSPGQPAGPHVMAGFLVPLRGQPAVLSLLLPSSRPVGLLFWGAVVIAGLVVDQLARRSGGALATSGDLVRFATSALPIRIVLIAAWLFAGYHLFAR
jgi:hypothetical protein